MSKSLVGSNPTPSAMYNLLMEKFLAVQVYNTRLEAGVDKSYLHSEGIESHIEADDAGGAKPFPFQPNISGVLLKVSEKDFKKAKELLDKVSSK